VLTESMCGEQKEGDKKQCRIDKKGKLKFSFASYCNGCILQQEAEHLDCIGRTKKRGGVARQYHPIPPPHHGHGLSPKTVVCQ
jgi:hypothetical protein